jgi:hypothetical protein
VAVKVGIIGRRKVEIAKVEAKIRPPPPTVIVITVRIMAIPLAFALTTRIPPPSVTLVDLPLPVVVVAVVVTTTTAAVAVASSRRSSRRRAVVVVIDYLSKTKNTELLRWTRVKLKMVVPKTKFLQLQLKNWN